MWSLGHVIVAVWRTDYDKDPGTVYARGVSVDIYAPRLCLNALRSGVHFAVCDVAAVAIRRALPKYISVLRPKNWERDSLVNHYALCSAQFVTDPDDDDLTIDFDQVRAAIHSVVAACQASLDTGFAPNKTDPQVDFEQLTSKHSNAMHCTFQLYWASRPTMEWENRFVREVSLMLQKRGVTLLVPLYRRPRFLEAQIGESVMSMALSCTFDEAKSLHYTCSGVLTRLLIATSTCSGTLFQAFFHDSLTGQKTRLPLPFPAEEALSRRWRRALEQSNSKQTITRDQSSARSIAHG